MRRRTAGIAIVIVCCVAVFSGCHLFGTRGNMDPSFNAGGRQSLASLTHDDDKIVPANLYDAPDFREEAHNCAIAYTENFRDKWDCLVANTTFKAAEVITAAGATVSSAVSGLVQPNSSDARRHWQISAAVNTGLLTMLLAFDTYLNCGLRAQDDNRSTNAKLVHLHNASYLLACAEELDRRQRDCVGCTMDGGQGSGPNDGGMTDARTVVARANDGNTNDAGTTHPGGGDEIGASSCGSESSSRTLRDRAHHELIACVQTSLLDFGVGPRTP